MTGEDPDPPEGRPGAPEPHEGSTGRAGRRIVVAVLLVIPSALTAVQLAIPDEGTAGTYSDIAVPAVLGVGLCFGLLVLKKLDDPESQRFGLLFSSMVGLWFSAETLFAAFDFLYGSPPDVSVADLLFIAGYLPPMAYLWSNLSERRRHITPVTILVTVVAWGLGAAATLQALFGAGIPSGPSALIVTVTLLYPALDLSIILLLLLVLPIWRRSGFRAYWGFIFMSLCDVAVADIMYYFQKTAGTYRTGGLPDAVYLLGYAFMAAGFGYLLYVVRPGSARASVPAVPAGAAEPGAGGLAAGHIYLIQSAEPEKKLGLFVRNLRGIGAGICITRAMPATLRDRHPLGSVPVFWLSHHSSQETLDPFRLELIAATVHDHMKKSKNLTVWVDGLEYLSTQNGFVNVLKWVQRMRDQVAVHEAVMLLSLDPQAFDPKELTLLRRETRSLPDGWES
jgi:hypothetical protein